jgi:hypothetical protein
MTVKYFFTKNDCKVKRYFTVIFHIIKCVSIKKIRMLNSMLHALVKTREAS